MKRTIIFLLLFCFVSVPVIAQQSITMQEERTYEITDEIKDICNKMIMAIYDDIKKESNRYTLLNDFGRKNIETNEYGIKKIKFEYERQAEAYMGGNTAYSFEVDVIKFDDKVKRRSRYGSFQYEYPRLGLKVVGYQKNNFRLDTMDLDKIVRRYSDILMLRQQERLPIRLRLESLKSSYKAGQPVEIKVRLENMERSHKYVKALDTNTLIFYNDDNEPKDFNLNNMALDEIVLKGSSYLTKVFVLNGFEDPGEYCIKAKYIKTIEGVNLFDRVFIQVTE